MAERTIYEVEKNIFNIINLEVPEKIKSPSTAEQLIKTFFDLSFSTADIHELDVPIPYFYYKEDEKMIVSLLHNMDTDHFYRLDKIQPNEYEFFYLYSNVPARAFYTYRKFKLISKSWDQAVFFMLYLLFINNEQRFFYTTGKKTTIQIYTKKQFNKKFKGISEYIGDIDKYVLFVDNSIIFKGKNCTASLYWNGAEEEKDVEIDGYELFIENNKDKFYTNCNSRKILTSDTLNEGDTSVFEELNEDSESVKKSSEDDDKSGGTASESSESDPSSGIEEDDEEDWEDEEEEEKKID